MKFAKQSLTLVLSIICVFIWQNSPLKDYTVEILGLFIVLYFIVSSRKKGKGFLTMGGEGLTGVFILNSLIFLLVFSTGGLNSGLFFILYFLAFGIAFVFDPLNVFIFVLGAILLFIPTLNGKDITPDLLKLGSLLLLSPLAYFFGAQYKKSDKDQENLNAIKEREKEAADTISEDVEEVIKDEKTNLKQEDLEKLNEVLEETDDLRTESKE